jgi:hypothetical protein
MKNSLVLLCLFLLILAAACSSSKRLTSETVNDYHPPGTILIGENLFYDETECTNISYREYLYWLSYNFGFKSLEHLRALPDTTVWIKDLISSETCLLDHTQLYLSHPNYSYYPVVGVSQEQARAFSDWRSDRVMEFILVRDKIIDYNPNKSKNQLFSIRRYYTDSLDYIKSDEKLEYYPNYRLPSIDERKKIIHKLDSVSKTDFKNKKKYSPNWNEHYYRNIRAGISPCYSAENFISPTSLVYSEVDPIGFHHLRGNVKEWLESDSLACGGGWKETKLNIMQFDISPQSMPNKSTGFRNVCEWKKWTP